jgi:1,4-dihydroxy-2-naphthoate octaprenyltransferase
MDISDRLKHIQHIRPVHIMTLFVLYLTGVGFARYLGEQIDLTVTLIGLAWILTISLGLNYLGDHFQSPFDAGLYLDDGPKESQKPDGNADVDHQRLFYSVGFLAMAAVLTVILVVIGSLSLTAGSLVFSYFLIYSILVIPGLELGSSGIGEFLVSVVLVVLPPAVGYALQTGSFHRFIYLGIFPLYPIHLAMILVFRLRSYPYDIRAQHKTLLVRIGWVRAVFIHNLLILSGFLLFGAAILFGMPSRMVFPVFFVLPVAGYLIWYLARLEDGMPVRWPLILLLSLVTFFLPVYLITYTAWVR